MHGRNAIGHPSTMANCEVDGIEMSRPLIRQYQANETVKREGSPLQNMLVNQPFSLGTVQKVCGIGSFILGVALVATSSDLTFCILFRVPIFTGLLFFIAGWLSNLLYRFPGLMQVSYIVNIGSLVVAAVGTILLTIDLSRWSSSDPKMALTLRMTVVVLCMTVLEIIATAVLLYWLHRVLKTGQTSQKVEP